MSDLVKLGAVWKGKDKDGKPMLTGTINGNTRILILANGYKKEEKHPDYLVYLTPAEKKEGEKDDHVSDEEMPF